MSKEKMTLKGENELAAQIKELSSGKWERIAFQSGPTAFITGVGKIEQMDGGTYSETFLETILPETDEEYDDQLPRIIAISEMACRAVNNTYGAGINPEAVGEMLQALADVVYVETGVCTQGDRIAALERAKAAIEKAKM